MRSNKKAIFSVLIAASITGALPGCGGMDQVTNLTGAVLGSGEVHDEASALLTYNTAIGLLNASQYQMAEALGLKEEASLLLAQKEVLAGETTLSEQQLKEIRNYSDSVNQKIEDALATQPELDEKSKQRFMVGAAAAAGSFYLGGKLINNPSTREYLLKYPHIFTSIPNTYNTIKSVYNSTKSYLEQNGLSMPPAITSVDEAFPDDL